MAKKAEEVKQPEINVAEMIDGYVTKAKKALHEFMSMDQEQINKIVKAMALAGLDKHMELAKMAVEETGRGIFEDKITKNMFATEYIYHSIKNEKTVGVIAENDLEDYEIVAEPLGVICGVTPVTNPTSTTMFKSLISIKARNPIIFGFHPAAQQCSVAAAKVLLDAAVQAGAPENCIQWIEYPSIEATNALMNHPGIATVLATGGSGMVKAAYSTGKPALGVGPGNVPCYIHKSCDLKQAVNDLVMSKSFDNGMICASEQAAIVDKEISAEFEELMKQAGCYFPTDEEVLKISNYCFNPEGKLNAAIVGKAASWIAEQAGVSVPKTTKVLVCRIGGVGPDHPLSREKLSPVLAYMTAENPDQGIDLAEQMVLFNGMGHSAVIHAKDKEVIDKFASIMKASRLIVNSPSSHGAIGDLYNTSMPSLTLGCGSYGGNSVSGNVTTLNLINQKRVAKRRINMQWFKVPDKIYFEYDSIQYLEKMPDISRAFIVTDPGMVSLGYVDKILYYLRKREQHVHCEIFSEVEPDPSVETVMKGAEMMREFKPDVIIALGGGSAMDAAKGMWLFYEHPDADFNGLRLRFLDIRKRAFKFPKMGIKAKMVAIPTTSGTGSEVTSFAVISDKKNNMKYPLADYELTPDVAIIDPQFVLSLPKGATADTGLDVLTHAIEAYVSVMASDYTDALAIKACQLVFEYLPRAYKNGANDREAREKMHNASCMAGMAFTNAFLGVNHSIAHKIGGEYHVPHGRANAVLLPYVIRYNSQQPTKLVSWPKYKSFIADKKYAEIAHACGFGGKTVEEGVNNLINAVKELMKTVGEPASFAECGIDETEYMSKIEDLSYKAFEDQCTTANPRLPLVTEIQDIMRKAYKGE